MDKSMSLEMATLTAKGQVTIPKPVRDALGLRQGDQLSWELDDGCVTVRLITPLDLAYLTGIETHLSEWASTADDEAFADVPVVDETKDPFPVLFTTTIYYCYYYY